MKELLTRLDPLLDTQRVQAITKEIEETEDNKKRAMLVEELQTMNNTLYEKQGDLTDETLAFQVYINTLRNKYDITDPREIIHTDNGKGYVQ